jgi:hypothetical protein
MKKIIIILMFVYLVLGISACAFQAKSQVETLPGVDLADSHINAKFHLFAQPTNGNAFQNNQIFFIHLDNLSNQNIVFPSDYAVKMFSKVGSEWKSVFNMTTYANKNDHILFPQESFGLETAVMPYIPQLARPTLVRVLVIGTVYDGDQPTNDLEAAYCDITLNP